MSNFIVNEGEELKTQSYEASYHELIDYCIYNFKIAISNKYRSIRTAHDTIAEYEDKLYFDMSQKELAVLLAVLIRAGYIHRAPPKIQQFTASSTGTFTLKIRKPQIPLHEQLA